MSGKVCNECKEYKPAEAYYTGTQRGKNGQVWKYLDSKCIPCRLAYGTKRRKATKVRIVEYLGGVCLDCGIVDVPEIYDCHHLDGSTKEFSPAKVGGRSFESIKEELDKCVLLCANCHRKRHWGI